MPFIQTVRVSNYLQGQNTMDGKPGAMNPKLEQARLEYNNGYYAEKLEQGLEFQDVVTRALYQRGIVVIGYASRRFQNSHGENMLGAEIKREGKFRETGNLYIETSEKYRAGNPTSR